MVCSNLSSLAVRLTHSSSPKGRPLSMLTRTRPNSFALSGAFTRSVQSTGRSTGQGDELALIASSPCILAHRPLQMFVALHREAFDPSHNVTKLPRSLSEYSPVLPHCPWV